MSNTDRMMNGEWDFHLIKGHPEEWKITLNGEAVKGIRSFKVSADALESLPVITLTIIPSRCNLFVDKAESMSISAMTADATAIGDEHKGRVAL